MKVLVTGGDGFVGRHLCAELVDRGHAVTSLSRTPEPAVLPDSVTTTSGDVTEYESIEAAYEGMDAAVNLTALLPGEPTTQGEHNTTHHRVVDWVVPDDVSPA